MTPTERRKKKRQAQKARERDAAQTAAIGVLITETPAELSASAKIGAPLVPQPSSPSEILPDNAATGESKIDRKTSTSHVPSSVARTLGALSAPAKIEDIATLSSSTIAAVAQASVSSSSGVENKEVKPIRSEEDLLEVLTTSHSGNHYQPLMNFFHDFLSRLYRYQYADPFPTEEDCTIVKKQYDLLNQLFFNVGSHTDSLKRVKRDWITRLASNIHHLSGGIPLTPTATEIAEQVSEIYSLLHYSLSGLLKIPLRDEVLKKRKPIIIKETKSFIDQPDCKADYIEGRGVVNQTCCIAFIGSGQDILVNSEKYIYGYDGASRHPTSRHSILPYSLSLHYAESLRDEKLIGHAFCPERRREKGSGDKNQAFIAGVIDAGRPVLCWTPLQCIRPKGGYLIQELFWLAENNYTFVPSEIYPEMVWAVPPATPKINRGIPISANQDEMQSKMNVIALKLYIDHPGLKRQIQDTTTDLAVKDDKELCSKKDLLALSKEAMKSYTLEGARLDPLRRQSAFLLSRIDILTAEVQSLMAKRIARMTVASPISTAPTVPFELPLDSPVRASTRGGATSSREHATASSLPSPAKNSA